MCRRRTKNRGIYESQREAGVGCKFTELPCSKSLFRHRDLVEFQRLQFCLRRTRGTLGVRLWCLLCCGKDINKGQAQQKSTSSCVGGKPGPAQEGVIFGLCRVTDKARC
jgi:hypothetical protein